MTLALEGRLAGGERAGHLARDRADRDTERLGDLLMGTAEPPAHQEDVAPPVGECTQGALDPGEPVGVDGGLLRRRHRRGVLVLGQERRQRLAQPLAAQPVDRGVAHRPREIGGRQGQAVPGPFPDLDEDVLHHVGRMGRADDPRGAPLQPGGLRPGQLPEVVVKRHATGTTGPPDMSRSCDPKASGMQDGRRVLVSPCRSLPGARTLPARRG